MRDFIIGIMIGCVISIEGQAALSPVSALIGGKDDKKLADAKKELNNLGAMAFREFMYMQNQENQNEQELNAEHLKGGIFYQSKRLSDLVINKKQGIITAADSDLYLCIGNFKDDDFKPDDSDLTFSSENLKDDDFEIEEVQNTPPKPYLSHIDEALIDY